MVYGKGAWLKYRRRGLWGRGRGLPPGQRGAGAELPVPPRSICTGAARAWGAPGTCRTPSALAPSVHRTSQRPDRENRKLTRKKKIIIKKKIPRSACGVQDGAAQPCPSSGWMDPTGTPPGPAAARRGQRQPQQLPPAAAMRALLSLCVLAAWFPWKHCFYFWHSSPRGSPRTRCTRGREQLRGRAGLPAGRQRCAPAAWGRAACTPGAR